MYDTNTILEKVILIAVDSDKSVMPIENCLDELSELVKTSGAEEVGRLVQKRESIHRVHYLGKGKVEELRDLISLTNATGIVCDDELTSTQQKNLGELLNTKVMDRTMVILDIFAARANTAEGKVQVELAQLKYNLSHLTGLGKQLSRLGGGIGTRGPGEKKLEMDRRYIKDRIAELNKELLEISTHREVLREKRRKSSIPVISLVGYTNSGKSTLMNTISNADVIAEDKLFATLDTTTRKITLLGGSEVLITDTVGFIQKLPHNLIKAFRATLEEMKYADILLHVVDASNSVREAQMDIVYKTLTDLDCMDKPIITVFNKIDSPFEKPLPNDKNAHIILQISALEKIGIETLQLEIENILKSFRNKISVLIPFTEGKILNAVHGSCEIILEEHTGEGTYLEVYADSEMTKRLEKYVTTS